MREQMQRMQEEMNKIAQTPDPQERQRLLQHWQSMYLIGNTTSFPRATKCEYTDSPAP